MKIGVLGSGDVAKTLAGGFVKHGHQVTIGTRNAAKLADWAKQKAGANVGSFADAAKFGEMVVLAVKGKAAIDVLQAAGAANLNGKTIIDTTNPMADSPPDHGVIRFFTTLEDSLMERLQKAVPGARFVKAFNSVGNAFMIDPHFSGGKPTMFICGDDTGAKTAVTKLLDQLGWETCDMGGVQGARAIEPLCILWCIPGMLRNEWSHAFKLLR